MGIEKAAEWAAKYLLTPEVQCSSRPVGDYVHVGYEAHPEDTGSSGYRAGPTTSFRQQQYYLDLLSSTGETLAEVQLPFFEKDYVARRKEEVIAELFGIAIREQFRRFIPGGSPCVELPEYSEKELCSGKNGAGRDEPAFAYEIYLVEGPDGRFCELRTFYSDSNGKPFCRRLSPDNFRQNSKQPSCLTACWKGSRATLVMSKEKAESLFSDMDWEWTY